MSIWMQTLVLAALLGSALMAGLFFAFSTFIMKAFAEIPSDAGVHAMRSINRVIINPWFIVAFIGTSVLSVVIGTIAIIGKAGEGGVWFLTAAALYLAGTILVTGTKNVPLNNQLENVPDAEVDAFWQHYLTKWTHYNHSRAVASSLAVVFYGIGLMRI